MNEGKETEYRKKKQQRFFVVYITNFIRQINKRSCITNNAKNQLNSALCIISKRIFTTCKELVHITNRKTLNYTDIERSLEILFGNEIASKIRKFSDERIVNFSENDSEKISRKDRAGLLFSPAVTERFLRDFGLSKILITKTSPIYLASVLEYIMLEICKPAIDLTVNSKRVRITIRDLELSIRSSPDMNRIMESCNIEFLGGGVVPFIHDFLLVKPKRRKDANKKSRNGESSIRNIKKMQKSNGLAILKRPFESYVRELAKKIDDKTKISKKTFVAIQYYVEQYIIDLLKSANDIAVHSSRVKVNLDDVLLACKIKNTPHTFSKE